MASTKARLCTCWHITCFVTGGIICYCCEIKDVGRRFLTMTTSVISSHKRIRYLYQLSLMIWNQEKRRNVGNDYTRENHTKWLIFFLGKLNLVSTQRSSAEMAYALIFSIYEARRQIIHWNFGAYFNRLRVVICSNNSVACLLRIVWDNMWSCGNAISLCIDWRVGT